MESAEHTVAQADSSVVLKIVPSLLTPEQVREELIAHFHGYRGITHGWEQAVADLVISKLSIVTLNPQSDCPVDLAKQ